MWMFLRNQKHKNVVPQWSDDLQMITNEQKNLFTLPNKNYHICPVLSNPINANPRLSSPMSPFLSSDKMHFNY